VEKNRQFSFITFPYVSHFFTFFKFLVCGVILHAQPPKWMIICCRPRATTPLPATRHIQPHTVGGCHCYHHRGVGLTRQLNSIQYVHTYTGGRDSSVGIATHYRLDGPRFETRCRQHFRCAPRPAPSPKQPPVQLVPVLSWRIKRTGRGADQPPHI